MRKIVGGLIAAVVLAGGLTFAQGSYQTLHDLPAATIRGYWNEVAIDEKAGAADPVKLRMGAWESVGTGYLGAISCDRLEGAVANPVRREKCLIAFKMDPIPTVEIYVQRTATSTEDRDMVRALRINAQGAEFGVPIRAIATGATDRMISPDGRFTTIQQGDGNFVTYDASLAPIGNPAGAVWSAWSGRIR